LFIHPKKFVACALLLLALTLNSCVLLKQNTESEHRQITDETGRQVRISGKIERIISLAPNLTEIIYAVGAGDRLVGNTTYCDYPEQAKSVQKVGDTLQPNIERILALRPNLIFISTSSQLEAFAKQLNEHSIPVYVSDPHDLEGVFRSIHNLGLLLDRQQQAEELLNQLRKRTAVVEKAVFNSKSVRVFYQLSAEPLYTAGRDAFVTDLIRRAGGLSVTADLPEAWPRYSEESAVAARPDAIILPTGGSMGAANSDVAAGLKKAPAVLNGKVIKIDGDLLVRPGPRAIEGLEKLAHALHPDAFK
jgi:cobalamin transport system substrate-binding protein